MLLHWVNEECPIRKIYSSSYENSFAGLDAYYPPHTQLRNVQEAHTITPCTLINTALLKIKKRKYSCTCGGPAGLELAGL